MISIFEATFGEEVGSDAGEFPNDGSDLVGTANSGTIQVREANVFNIRQTAPASGQWITKGATPTAVDLSINVTTTFTATAETWNIRRYGTLGDDPSPDAGATAFTRCASGTTYTTTTSYRTTGVKSVTLGATAITDATDRLQNDATVWGISIQQQNETVGAPSRGFTLDEYTAGTAANRPRLQVTWKAVRDPIGGCGMCCPGQRL